MGHRRARWHVLVHLHRRSLRQQREGVLVMSTTTTTTSTASAESLATSVKFMAFAFAMGLATPILYVLCDVFGLPLFTFHPATNRVDLFWAPGRSGEGPAMYWYGWTATVLVVGAAMGIVATLFPQQKVSTFTILMTA